jgi:hypothetical protein
MIEVQKSLTISRLALLKSAQCLHEGRPEEAWQWLRSLFRFSRHIGNPGIVISRIVGAALHNIAHKQLIAWASHKSVTTEHLQVALIELRLINTLTAPLSANIKAEYLASMKLLSSPVSVREYFQSKHSLWSAPAWKAPEPLVGSHLFLNAEPELCEVLLRHVFANHLSQCDLPRWERKIAETPRVQLFLPSGRETPALMDTGTLGDAVMRSRMALSLAPSSIHVLDSIDREQARQLAYELCFTVELFRRKHGEYPESLETLVPEFLDQVPRDPFGSKLTERMLMIRREARVQERSTEDEAALQRPCLIIYSRGGNGMDDGGEIARQTEDIGIRIPINTVPKSN